MKSDGNGDASGEIRLVWPPNVGAGFGGGGAGLPTYTRSITTTPNVLCPDLLSIRNIGEADGWRGRLVRGFFKVLAVITGL